MPDSAQYCSIYCNTAGKLGSPEDISETIDTAVQELGGDKSGNWKRWCKENIPIAEQLYLDYTTEAEE